MHKSNRERLKLVSSPALFHDRWTDISDISDETGILLEDSEAMEHLPAEQSFLFFRDMPREQQKEELVYKDVSDHCIMYRQERLQRISPDTLP